MYFALGTRLDTVMGVTLGHFCQDLGMLHREAAKKMLRLMNGSAGNRLLYLCGKDVTLKGTVMLAVAMIRSQRGGNSDV